LIFPKKRDNLFSRCQNIPDRKGEQPKRIFDARSVNKRWSFMREM